MNPLALYLSILFFFWPGFHAQAQQALLPDGAAQAVETPAPAIQISAPAAGQAVQGNFSILGSIAVEGFQSAEITFAYSEHLTKTWFLISQINTPVTNGILAQWDTTMLTDGVYDLRLVVTLKNNTQKTATVEGLRIRNYTPVETDTPIPVLPSNTPPSPEASQPTLTATPTFTPTPTVPLPATPSPLPPNPAQLSQSDVMLSLGKGALVIIGLFVLAGIYQAIKSLITRGLG